MTAETLLGRPGGEMSATPAVARALLLAPSEGLGGGIERYAQTVQSALSDYGVRCARLNLPGPGLGGHRALLAAAAAALPRDARPTRLIAAHRALLPVAALLATVRPVSGISVICHGSDVWGGRARPRWQLESRLMRRRDVRIVAVSSFTAGALVPTARAAVLPPGLSRAWFDELVDAQAQAVPGKGGLRLITAFRLDDWRDKGLRELTDAIAMLPGPAVRLTVCGSGTAPPDLLAHVGRLPWCTLRPGLADRELAAELASSDLFVLATRTRSGRVPCGEGFGLVLLEAQLAGTAVVGPAHGGSPDAYLDGITGATPRDEGVPALATVIAALLSDQDWLAEMGRQGAALARRRFDPGRYAALVVDRLL